MPSITAVIRLYIFIGITFVFVIRPLGKQDDQQNQQNRNGYDRSHQQRVDLDCVRRNAGDPFFLDILDAVTSHQQPMGIYAIWRAGDEGAVILAFDNLQSGGLLRLDDQYLIDLIGQHLIENPEHEYRAFLQLIEVGEQLCAGQTAMTGQNAMGALSGRLDHSRCPMAICSTDSSVP